MHISLSLLEWFSVVYYYLKIISALNVIINFDSHSLILVGATLDKRTAILQTLDVLIF